MRNQALTAPQILKPKDSVQLRRESRPSSSLFLEVIPFTDTFYKGANKKKAFMIFPNSTIVSENNLK
jgi:hypothetical protein